MIKLKLFLKLILLIFVLFSYHDYYSQSITWLGFISPGGAGSSAEGVSADGQFVVGSSSAPGNQYHAFLWSQSSGMTDLGTLGGHTSYGFDVSDSGNVVVGRSYVSLVGSVIRGFRWTASSGMQSLGTLGGGECSAFAVSADGSSIVGSAQTTNSSSPTHACIWHETLGLIDLGAPTNNSWSEGYCISSNNSIVAGIATFSSVFEHAAIWNQGWVDLGTLGGNDSYASGISEDGSVVIGSSRTSDGYIHAFRWTATTGLQDLGVLASGFNSQAFGVSADGNIIIGWAQNEFGQDRAVRWTISNGIEDLNVTYAGILGDAKLILAKDISPDGRYIVGTAYRNGISEAYLLDTNPSVIVEQDNPVPDFFELYQNYPNPFNSCTKISWQSPVSGWQTIKIFDLLGREIETITDGYYEAGYHSISYTVDSNLPSGVYYYKLSAGSFSDVKKMIMIK